MDKTEVKEFIVAKKGEDTVMIREVTGFTEGAKAEALADMKVGRNTDDIKWYLQTQTTTITTTVSTADKPL